MPPLDTTVHPSQQKMVTPKQLPSFGLKEATRHPKSNQERGYQADVH